MYKLLIHVFVLIILSPAQGQNKLPLNIPYSNIQRAILSGMPIDLNFSFRMDGAQICYTTDGTIPGKQSKKYGQLLHISKPCTIKARAFHPDFLPSEIKQVDFYNKGLKIDSIETTAANKKYSGNGPKTLIDNILGDTDFKSNYLGFNTDTAVIDLHFTHATKIKQVAISFGINQGAWIFPPYKITVRNHFGMVVGEKNISNANEPNNEYYRYIEMPIEGQQYNKLNITIETLSQLPQWHAGAGQKPWLFIDEVIVK
ncbi:MAG: chitobiase/beta-hexosaminidase C-terminal domain-containing protein [Saprospiraceae bacterium]|nr:chitobiase/beta-hexosaminidase C-terminal domain-containing protein [Saprospiraceae bacterium]